MYVPCKVRFLARGWFCCGLTTKRSACRAPYEPQQWEPELPLTQRSSKGRAILMLTVGSAGSNPAAAIVITNQIKETAMKEKEISMHFCAANKEEMLQALGNAIGEIMAELVMEKGELEDCDLPWEKKEPKVIEHAEWTAEEIRNFCLEEGYYTEGKVREYEEMLLFVDRNDPTPENIYKVAKNILDHSDQEHEIPVEYLMRKISIDLVNRHYEVRGYGSDRSNQKDC